MVVIVLILISFISAVRLFQFFIEYRAQKNQNQELVDIANNDQLNDEMASDPEDAIDLPYYQDLYEINNDFVGWLKIDNTAVDYPVVQTDDNDYYMDRDFYQEYTRYGTLFADYRCDIYGDCDNVIIYGHHMKDATMFGSLTKYLQRQYLDDHMVIEFNTRYERTTYKIVSVFIISADQIYEGEFNVYDFIEFNTESDFYEYIDYIRELSIFDLNTETEYGDSFITLSTCEYSVENGRLVVIGVRN